MAAPSFTPEFFAQVGIHYTPAVLTQGYLKFLPEDFIVEELGEQGSWSRVDGPSLELHTIPEGPWMLSRLVKRGMSTQHAVQVVADALKVDRRELHYAGLKDEQAVTAQQLSVPARAFRPYQTEQLIVEAEGFSATPLRIGQLKGNRFIIHVRSQGVNPQQLADRLTQIQTTGFPNFFSLQRFGSRLNNHLVGRAVLTGQFKEAVHLLISGESQLESPEIQALRQQAGQLDTDWRAIMELFQAHRESLRDEVKVLAHLVGHPEDYSAALEAAPESVRFCASAYASYCFNRALSHLLSNESLPETLPLFNSAPDVIAYYAPLLPDEPIQSVSWENRLRCLDTPAVIQLPTGITPTIYRAERTVAGELYYFDLPKGAYATGFLSELYALHQASQLPAEINPSPIDTLALLGRGPLSM